MAFYHTVAPNTAKVGIKIFTTAFRKVYEDEGLSPSAGQNLYTVDGGKAANWANGLYYLVLVEKSGGQQTRKIMKLIILK